MTEPISLVGSFPPITNTSKAESKGNFAGELGKAVTRGLESVNKLQHEADDLAIKLLTGELDDLHQLTIAAEKASIALQTAVHVRNKVVEAYQEISRMQV